MVGRKITREELENLYSHDGITRKELRYLLRITPNQISNKLSEVFRKDLNPFKISGQHEITIRGFIHAPHNKLLKIFNSIHYQIISELGQYNLMILSSSPNDLETAIPIIVQKELLKRNKFSPAHFAEITGSSHNFTQYNPKAEDAIFLIAKEIHLLGFNELFSTVDPVLKLADLDGMLKDRFNIPELEKKSIFFWLMSSPVYEARAGGNSFSPISPSEEKFKCNQKILEDFQTDLLKILMPYFTKSKPRNSTFNYTSPIKNKLTYFQAPELYYKYENKLDLVKKFLKERQPLGGYSNSEINISTTSLELKLLTTRSLETFVRKPMIDSEILRLTDIPILFTNNDLLIDDSENEIFEYNMEISQLIYQSHLRINVSPFKFEDTLGAVKELMDKKMNSFPELQELMRYGIIFDPGIIGGLGEHLTRISNSILRSEGTLNKSSAIKKSEDLFVEMITKLFDEYNKPIKDLYYLLEEKRAERDQIKSHRLRTTINSILFDLNNTFEDGWKYTDFEKEFKKRTNSGAKRSNEIFKKLIEQKEISERSPGLYWHILGFDRYL